MAKFAQRRSKAPGRPRADAPRRRSRFGLPLLAALLFPALVLAQSSPKPPKINDPALRIELIATVPEVEACTTVCSDSHGAIYVGNDPRDGRLNTKEPVCTIVRFSKLTTEGAERTEGGGKRKRTVFADKLYSPAGSAWHGDWLYVIHDPLMSRFKDTNGDGVADVREDLITNLGLVPYEGLNDHCVSGFTLGMDGYFYISVGDRGIYQAKSARDGSTITMQGGGIARCRTDGTALEIFSTGTRNHLSVNLDAEDNAFTRDNTDDGNGWWTRLTHHIEGGYYGYPYHYRRAPNYGVTQPSKETLSAIRQHGIAGSAASPVLEPRSSEGAKGQQASTSSDPSLPLRSFAVGSDTFLPAMTDFGGGSPTGGLCYLSDGLPEKYRGKHFFSEWGKAGLFVTELARDGATFKLVSDTKLVEPDKGGEFRPMQIAVAADGALLIADWGYGGWKSPRVAGAVWRLYWPEAKPAPRLGDESKANVDELIAALGHPDREQRMRAQWALSRKAAEEELAAPQALASLPSSTREPIPIVPNPGGTIRPFAEQEKSLIFRLTKLVGDASAAEIQRSHALWTIQLWVSDARLAALPQYQGNARAILHRVPQRVAKAVANSTSATVRAQAARLVGEEDRFGVLLLGYSALGILHADRDPAVRLHAAIARGRVGLGRNEDLPMVLALTRDPDPSVRFAGAVTLRRLMWWPAVFAGITTTLSAPEPPIRDTAFWLLGTGLTEGALSIVGPYAHMRLAQGHGTDVVETLTRASQSSDADLRTRAAAAFGRIACRSKPYDGHWWATQPVKSLPPLNSVAWAGTPKALEALSSALADADAGVRFAAAEAFSQFVLGTEGAKGGEQNAPALALAVANARTALRVRLKAEMDAAVRRQIIESLGVQRDPDAVLAFTQIALDEKADPAFRESAIGAVVKVGGDGARKAITQLAEAPLSPAATQRVIAAIGELKLAEVAPALLRHIRGTDEKVGVAAVKALGALGPKAWPPDALRTLLLALNGAPKGVQLAAIEVLAGAKAKEAVPQLIAMVETNKLRNEALAALATMPDVQSVPVLVAALADKNGGTRRVLLKALKPLREQALPLIKQQLASSAIPAEFAAEIRAAFDSGIITKWKMIGTFENVWGAVHPVESDILGVPSLSSSAPSSAGDTKPGVERPGDEEKGKEQRARGVLARRYPNAEGKEVGWIDVNADAETGRMNLEKLFKTNAMVCAYAFTAIKSAEPAETKLLCGSDDQIAIWLNGKKVHDASGSRGFEPDKDEVRLHLAAGTNQLLVKIGNNGGGWEFAARVPGVEEGKFIAVKGTAPEEKQRGFALATKPDGSWLHPGNVQRGEKLFHDATAPLKAICATCHAVGAFGGQIGPNLSMIGGVYPRADLITSILEPSKTNALGFEQVMIETRGGETVVGAVRQETADALTVMGADGKPRVLKKSDVQARQPLPLSMMPPGLTLGLQPEEFVDLLAYLESLRGQ